MPPLQQNGKLRAFVGVALMSLVVLACCQAWSQEDDPNRNGSETDVSRRNHFVFKVGGLYEQGDFGTPSTTQVLFVPMTFRYSGEKFDLSATPSVGLIHSNGDVVLIDGSPTPTGSALPSQTFGVGDTLIKARLFLTDDGGWASPRPGRSTGPPARSRR